MRTALFLILIFELIPSFSFARSACSSIPSNKEINNVDAAEELLKDSDLTGRELAGKFVFLRLRYTVIQRRRLDKNWATDFPTADCYVQEVLKQLTTITVQEGLFAINADDKNLMRFPFLFSTEPGSMELNGQEAMGLARYLEKGGFWFISDFWGDQELEHLKDEIKKIQ
ncbi:MAG: DUF4159 domain-containing protein [Elusimicrobia bacterium]|nr:DUF4159 domain-containing protein [Elusimicrobiota bacterium]